MSDEDMVLQDHRDNATDGLSDNLMHWKQLTTVSDSMFCQPVGVFSSWQCGYQTSPQHGHSPITSALSAIPGLGNQICTLILDTGASKCSTGNRNDFVDYQAFDDHNKKALDGIAAGLHIEGFGTVEYVITADDNSQITLSIQAYYVPGLADTRLVSPQGLVTSDGLRGSFEAHCNIDDPDSFAVLRFRKPGPYWQYNEPTLISTIKYDSRDNLPKCTATFPHSSDETEKLLMGAIKSPKTKT